MTRTSLGVRTGIGTISAAALEIIPGAKSGFFLRQVDITLVAATASVYALGRPAAIGITPTTPVLVPIEGGAGITLSASTALAWATPPTVPTSFYRRASALAAIGTMITWTFAALWIPVGQSIVLWNLAANSVADVNIQIDENQ
jgi:hypothetical protein